MEDAKFKLAIFRSFRPWLNKESKSVPSSTQEVVPNWYKDADRFAKMPNGEYYKAPKDICPFPKEGTTDDYGKIPTWKACPAILDAFLTGYVLKTPCDIEFFKNDQGIIDVKINDSKYKDFVTKRPPMAQFEHPKGFHQHHFAWYPDWEVSLPDGYSALFMTPMNRFDLPFLNTSGIIDSDKVSIPGTFPFFVAEGGEGLIPAGTPYMQFLPFKRENWEHEIEILDQATIYDRMVTNMKTYRQPDGGVYKNKVWSRREYK
jgi:hypothetical protein